MITTCIIGGRRDDEDDDDDDIIIVKCEWRVIPLIYWAHRIISTLQRERSSKQEKVYQAEINMYLYNLSLLQPKPI